MGGHHALPRHRVRKIISGGQTGVDRAALDAAMELGLDHGGYCPRGRRSDDGVIPSKYQLTETASTNYAERTEQNVLVADGTLLITRGRPRGGSALTERLARQHRKPLLHLDLDHHPDPLPTVLAFVRDARICVLNVAGPRERHQPGIGSEVCRLLLCVFGPRSMRVPTGVPQPVHESESD